MKQAKKHQNKKINDIILIAAVFLIAAIALCAYLLLQKEGERVVVTVDGKEYASYPLDKELSEEIVTEYGRNLLVIKDGVAFVSEADCPDLICVHHRPVSNEGETVVCMPNRLVVSIE